MWRTAMVALTLILLLVPLTSAAEPRSLDDAFVVEMNQVYTPTMHAGFGGNCLYFHGAAQLVSGAVVATWDAQTPLSERLELVFVTEDDWKGTRVQGTSPLRLDLEDVTLAEDAFASALLSVQLAGDGVAWDQQVTLDLEWDYVADDDLSVTTGGCTIG